MHNISRNKRVRRLLWTRVLLRFICRVDDCDAVAVGAYGREGDLRRRKMVRSRDVWFGGCFCRWSSSGEVDDVAAGAGNHTKFSSTPTGN